MTLLLAGQDIFFRSMAACACALAVSWLIGPKLIRKLREFKVGQVVRNDGPKTHFDKAGTPTMGGVLFLFATLVASLLFADLSNHYVLLLLFVWLGFGAIGFVDDYRKLIRKNTKGLPAKWKYLWQSLIAIIATISLFYFAQSPAETGLYIPVLHHTIHFLPLYFIVAYFAIVGSSNAVNLTDGLDGLAIVPSCWVLLALGLIAYWSSNADLAQHFHLNLVPHVNEIIVVLAAFVGSAIVFLWFNSYPAQIFMGDVGSLALGAAIGLTAVMVRQELLLIILGGIFVLETASVILQVASFKLLGRRIFKMAPLHHHFELAGWPEPKVSLRFWLISLIFVFIAMVIICN